MNKIINWTYNNEGWFTIIMLSLAFLGALYVMSHIGVCTK